MAKLDTWSCSDLGRQKQNSIRITLWVYVCGQVDGTTTMGCNLAFVFSPEGTGFCMVIFWIVRRFLPYFTACFVAIELVVRRAVS